MKILKAVVPWILTILLFVFLFSRIPVEKVLATLASADWGLYIAILVPYSGVYLLLDTGALAAPPLRLLAVTDAVYLIVSFVTFDFVLDE